jgi:demethylmenaquinone methyltransferase/2-methoxy-6-polyprenyl-1,4-benzoquinol methylase
MSSSPAPPTDENLPQGAAKVVAVRSMFDAIAPRYDLVNRLMTFGLDRGWRKRTVRSLTLSPGDVVLDIACGTGDLCRDLATGGYRPVGIDLSAGMLHHARTTAPLVHGDALSLPVADGSLDGAVSGFALRNFAELPALFAALARAVRPGGRIALLDVARPNQPLLRAATPCTSATSYPGSVACCPTGRRTATCPVRWPTSRPPPRSSMSCGDRASLLSSVTC